MWISSLYLQAGKLKTTRLYRRRHRSVWWPGHCLEGTKRPRPTIALEGFNICARPLWDGIFVLVHSEQSPCTSMQQFGSFSEAYMVHHEPVYVHLQDAVIAQSCRPGLENMYTWKETCPISQINQKKTLHQSATNEPPRKIDRVSRWVYRIIFAERLTSRLVGCDLLVSTKVIRVVGTSLSFDHNNWLYQNTGIRVTLVSLNRLYFICQ